MSEELDGAGTTATANLLALALTRRSMLKVEAASGGLAVAGGLRRRGQVRHRRWLPKPEPGNDFECKPINLNGPRYAAVAAKILFTQPYIQLDDKFPDDSPSSP